MNFNTLGLSPFSYIALGHIHKPQVIAEDKIAYCGSPEPLDLTETGPHGYFEGEIHPVTRRLTRLEFIPASALRYIPLAVTVTPETTNGGLTDRIVNEIEKRGREHIYRFRLKGMRDPDIEFDLSSFRPVFGSVRSSTNPSPSTTFPPCLRSIPAI